MARPRLEPNAENATIGELKETGRVGSSETALRFTAIQFLLAGTSREQVCDALEVTERALRKWIKVFNCYGIDGLIAKKRPGRTRILSGEQAQELVAPIEAPERVNALSGQQKASTGIFRRPMKLSAATVRLCVFFTNKALR